jgi:hypothetical protein
MHLFPLNNGLDSSHGKVGNEEVFIAFYILARV